MLEINPKKETERIIIFIKNTLKKANRTKLVIGLSGGVDSSVTAFLVQKAMGAKNLIILKMPYGELFQDKDADLIIDILKIPQSQVFEINIKPVVDLVECLIKDKKEKIDKIRLGNIMSRIRMTILYDFAKKYNGLVCGTENKSEYLLGYFTLHGDSASDLEPIRHLFKTQVIQLAKYLKISQSIIDKPPSAGLWPGQTDEKELGFSYKDADRILDFYFNQKKSKQEIIKKGINKKTTERVLNLSEANSFKRKPSDID